MVQNGKNLLLNDSKFGEYAAKNIDLSKIPTDTVPGITNLHELLGKLYELAKTEKLNDGTSLVASGITYSQTIGNKIVSNVEDALDTIIGHLFQLQGYTFPNIATTQQINNIIN